MGDEHWRLAQARRRRHRFSGRGRATLLTLGVVCVLAAALALVRPGSEPPPEAQAAEPEAPAEVAAGPSKDAPSQLLERLPVTRDTLELSVLRPPGVAAGRVGETGVDGRFFETVHWKSAEIAGPLRVEYTLDAALTREVFRSLKQGRVERGHVIVLEPDTGRVLAYASTDPEGFPATKAYPAASLIKVITAAAALDAAPGTANLPCRYTGSPYRLTPARIDPPRDGKTVTLRKALATSNNQCFAQLAVHAVGRGPLMEAIARFGWLAAPAPAHAAGSADFGEDRFDVGKLGCGLAGCRITPLHAVQLAASLANGELVTPRWVDRVVDARGRELPLPAVAGPRRVMSPDLAAELREMLVDTTTQGTAKSAFRRRNGRPLLGDVKVAGKTGSLRGTDPEGKYEWFIGVAPANDPKLAIATLMVHGDLWWRGASQLAADVLQRAFCKKGRCRAENAERWSRESASATASARLDTPPQS